MTACPTNASQNVKARSLCAHIYSAILACVALSLAAGCASSTPITTSKTKPSPFYLGADISTLSQVEQQGGVYMDGDKPGDALGYFHEEWLDMFPSADLG